MSPKSIPSLYSLSGTPSLTSIISTQTQTAISFFRSRSTSPTPSITITSTTTPPKEFIFPIPFGGNPSETLTLLGNQHMPCKGPNHNIHTLKNTSTTQPSIQLRFCSIHRSSLLNIQIISGVLFLFCLAITMLSPFSKRTENETSTPGRDQQDSLKSLHTNPQSPPNFPIQTQTHKLDTAQLKGIEISIIYFSIFVICSMIRAISYVMSRWRLCFGGERSDSTGVNFEDEEMTGYGTRRGSKVDDMV